MVDGVAGAVSRDVTVDDGDGDGDGEVVGAGVGEEGDVVTPTVAAGGGLTSR